MPPSTLERPLLIQIPPSEIIVNAANFQDQLQTLRDRSPLDQVKIVAGEFDRTIAGKCLEDSKLPLEQLLSSLKNNECVSLAKAVDEAKRVIESHLANRICEGRSGPVKLDKILNLRFEARYSRITDEGEKKAWKKIETELIRVSLGEDKFENLEENGIHYEVDGSVRLKDFAHKIKAIPLGITNFNVGKDGKFDRSRDTRFVETILKETGKSKPPKSHLHHERQEIKNDLEIVGVFLKDFFHNSFPHITYRRFEPLNQGTVIKHILKNSKG
jgi:hypothetical protein